ncbi:MAG: CHAD domain-containing protein [Bacteroidota bacterium]
MAKRLPRRRVTRRVSSDQFGSIGPFLAARLDERWRNFTVQVERTKRRSSEASIHDLRVSVRRLMATVDIVLAIMPDVRLLKARRTLKKHLRAFGELRDVHIQIIQLQELVRQFPVLKPFLQELKKREQVLVRGGRKHILRMRLQSLEQMMIRTRNGLLGLFTQHAMDSIGAAAALGAMGSAFARAIDLRQRVQPGNSKTIHMLRVAFKRCRYSVEVLQPLLSGVDAGLLKAMNAYQTRMGIIQDNEVLTATLSGYAVRKRRLSVQSLVAAQQHLAQRRAVLVREFLARIDELESFWRPPRAQLTHRRESGRRIKG